MNISKTNEEIMKEVLKEVDNWLCTKDGADSYNDSRRMNAMEKMIAVKAISLTQINEKKQAQDVFIKMIDEINISDELPQIKAWWCQKLKPELKKGALLE